MTSSPLAIAGLAVVVGASALLLRSLHAAFRERALLQATLLRVCGSGRLTAREDLVALKKFLNENIRFDPARRNDPRPLLRHSAAEILTLGQGFCGENARVAVLLMSAGGVRANRLYLDGPRWGHVIVEHEWDGGWKLFDGHADASVGMTDEEVGRIDAKDFAALNNTCRATNPWQNSFRIQLLGRLPLVRRWAALRPPRPLVFLMESPALLRALGSLGLLLAGFILVAAA